MRYLIVNADDFGYSFSVNEGIIEAYTKGIVTSTSVMVDAIASSEAADLAQFSNLSVGLHFVLSDFNNVNAELERQVEKFVSIVGSKPDHIDTHKMRPTNEFVKEELLSYNRANAIPIRCFGFAKFIDSFFGSKGEDDVSLIGLEKAIDEATDKYNELMCHVGYSDDYLRENSSYNDIREKELAAITSPSIRHYIDEQDDLMLCNWTQVNLSTQL